MLKLPEDRPRRFFTSPVTLPTPHQDREMKLNRIPPKTDHLSLEGFLGAHAPLALSRYENYHRENCNGVPKLSKNKAMQLIVETGVDPEDVLTFDRLCREKGWA